MPRSKRAKEGNNKRVAGDESINKWRTRKGPVRMIV
jgi:hypothetical protein